MNAKTLAPLLGLTLLAGSVVRAEDLSESRTIRKSLAVAEPQSTRLIVDNVWGPISVHGYQGSTIELEARETIQAKTVERIEMARNEVELEIFERDGEVELYVNGPFRCSERRRGSNCWNHWRDLYAVAFDFELKVPSDLDLELSTVTGGDIEVSGVRGDFTIHNVNGSIELEGMAGSGEVVTVNGRILASFEANPLRDSHFETINGKIDVSFQPDLSADLAMTARWGELWSDYEIVPLPSLPPTKRSEGGRTIIEIQGGSRVRVAKGGPTHSFETLNGNIYVRKGTSERGEDDA